jgi:hypothetical protein
MRTNESPAAPASGSRAQINSKQDRDTAPPSSAQEDRDTIAALDALRFEYLTEVFAYVESFAASAREAARRGNAVLLEVHAKQARLALVSALETRRELGSREAAP